MKLSKYLNLLSKFPHWNEVLSVFTYGGEAYLVAKSKQEDYIDPLGNPHKIWTSGQVDRSYPMLVNGSIHLETHPLSYGVIPYGKFKRKLAIEHTTGCSPWDFLQMVDLAKISYDNDPNYSQGCNLTFLMYKKFYERFMKSDFTDTKHGKEYFEDYKRTIDTLIASGNVDIIDIEPTQFWLEKTPYTPSNIDTSNAVCIMMNWCNFKKSDDVIKIAKIAEDIHKSSGKEVHIKLHSFCKESYLKYLNAPYIKILKYEDSPKYSVIDNYDTFFVDGTGIGYETAYRAEKFSKKVDIFAVTGFDSEYNQFEGVKCMNVLPVCSHEDYIRGARESSYPEGVIRDFFPHVNKDMIAFECYNTIMDKE